MNEDVVIYRTHYDDAKQTYYKVLQYLKDKEGDSDRDRIYVKPSENFIMVDGCVIYFYFGYIFNMCCLRPFLYNTDNEDASIFLKQCAEKVGGKEIKYLEELLKMIWEGERPCQKKKSFLLKRRMTKRMS